MKLIRDEKLISNFAFNSNLRPCTESTFPISPEDLIMKTKRILAANNGGAVQVDPRLTPG